VSISFSGAELLNIAIGIERRGVVFYDILSKSSEDALARDAFGYLANMEREHIQIFQGMLGEAGSYQFPEGSAGEYAAYFEALVENAVFTDDAITSQLATRAKNALEALELAIASEKDSILFYYEMRDIMPKQAQLIVNKIITEEKSHLLKLTELKGKLASKK